MADAHMATDAVPVHNCTSPERTDVRHDNADARERSIKEN